MLKSYKQLSRWYGALEPETGSPTPSSAGDRLQVARDQSASEVAPHESASEVARNESAGAGLQVARNESAGDGSQVARKGRHDKAIVQLPDDDDGQFPHYIRDPDEVRARTEVPADLPSTRSEFTGGWSDWVAGRAPGPDDDYIAPRNGDVVRFPWPDDYNDEHDEPPARPSRALRQEARRRSRRGRVIVVLVVAVLLLAAAAAGVLFLVRSAGDRAASGAHGQDLSGRSMQLTARSVQSTGLTDCPTERGERVLRSAEAGSTDSGPDVVLAFQYAYYVERSGERAREVVAPESTVSPATVIQHGIDTIPAGTTHCVRVTTLTATRYAVEVTEYRPGGAPATYNTQTVTTTVNGGRTLITGIAAG